MYCMVVTMTAFHAPRTALNVYEIYESYYTIITTMPYPWLVDMSHLLLVISSSVNVFIFSVQVSISMNIQAQNIVCYTFRTNCSGPAC